MGIAAKHTVHLRHVTTHLFYSRVAYYCSRCYWQGAVCSNAVESSAQEKGGGGGAPQI
jgi:hypothetical protein